MSAAVQFSIVPYVLELEAVFSGGAYYRKVPLPPGSMHVAVNRRVFLAEGVGESLRSTLRAAICTQASTPVLRRLEQELGDTVYLASVEGVALIADELPEVLLGRYRYREVLEPEPEYFDAGVVLLGLPGTPYWRK